MDFNLSAINHFKHIYKMKFFKHVFLILAMATTLVAAAQKSNITTAQISLRDRDYKEAKKYIDLAAANEETKNNPKMWYTRGDVYFAIAIDTTVVGQVLRLTDPEPAYKSLESYINCLKTGDEKFSKAALGQIAGDPGKVLGIAPYVYNEGLMALQRQNDGKDPNGFATAIRYFELILTAFPYDKGNKIKAANTELSENMVTKNTGKVAYFKKDWPLVNKYLVKLANENFADADVYITLSKAFQEQGDTASAIKYVEIGRNLLSENQDLITEELVLYSLTRQGDKLIEKLTKAIESDPNNSKYYYYRASTYEGLFKNDIKRTDYLDKAETDYKKSLEIDPNDADVNTLLGIMYFNKAVPIINERENTDNEKQKKKFDDLDRQATELLNISIKYYDASLSIKGDDIDVLNYLKYAYAQLRNMEKVTEIGKKIEALKASGK